MIKMINSPAKIFRYFLICFILGVTFASFFKVDYFFVYLLALFGFAAGVFFWPEKFWRIFQKLTGQSI